MIKEHCFVVTGAPGSGKSALLDDIKAKGVTCVAEFARAIIGRPRILLLDNFFKDVDSGIQKKINYLILALKKIGTTVIVFGEPSVDTSINFNKKYEIYNKTLEER